MIKKYRHVFILLVVCVVLAVAYFLLGFTADNPDGRVFSLDLDESITKVNISNEFGDFTLEKKDGWTVTDSTGSYRVNEEKMGLIEASLTNLCIYSDLGDTKEEYGLGSPISQVEFATTKGSTHNFKLGSKTPSGTEYYLKADQDRAFSVSASAADQFTGSLGAYRTNELFSINKHAIKGISCFLGEEKVVTLLAGKAGWALDYPVKVPARQVAVGELLSKISSWTVASYPDKGITIAEMGLEKPTAKLILTDGNQNSQELEFGRTEGPYIYTRIVGTDEIVKLYSTDIDFTSLSPELLMFVAPLKTEIDSVSEMSILVGKNSYNLTVGVSEAGQKYVLNGREISESEFSAIFYKYIVLSADGWDTTPPARTEPPVATLTSKLADGSLVTLELFRRDEETYYMSFGEEEIFWMNSQKLDELVSRLESL